MVYISLGSNCSVTWWLNKLELRTHAFPFDWSSFTLKHFLNVLEQDFNEFSETLKIKHISENHPDKDGKATVVIKNKYNFNFAHEVLKEENLEDFKITINRRIQRFKNIQKDNCIIYVRIELKIVKEDYLKDLTTLIKSLDKINENYILKLIINSNSIKIKINMDKIHVYYFEDFSPDWKMSHLDWKSILTIPSCE
jgi:hypothetical protein